MQCTLGGVHSSRGEVLLLCLGALQALRNEGVLSGHVIQGIFGIFRSFGLHLRLLLNESNCHRGSLK